MSEVFCLNPKYSTTRCVTITPPAMQDLPGTKFMGSLFLSHNRKRKAEGGLRTQGYFKISRPGNPLISVITVVFDGEKYLEGAIQSVINQDYDNLEYLVIDGYSNDGSLDIIKKYDKVIDYWVSEPDGGIYEAMNKGIRLSTGDVIAMLNADDYYELGALSLVSSTMTCQTEIIFYGDSISHYEDIGRSYIKKGTASLLNRGMTLSHQAMFVCKKVYEKYGLYNETYKYAADFDFALRTYLEGVKYVYIEQPLVNFRTGGASDKHFRVSYVEAYLILYERVGFIDSLYFGFTFLTRSCLRYLHRCIGKAMGHSMYLWTKKKYIAWRSKL